MEPEITVGIPVHNEVNTIGHLLRQIRIQCAGLNGQILVACSGSTDGTDALVRRFKEVDLIIESNRNGKVAALTLIRAHAKGEIIVLLDGDVILGNGALPALIQELRNNGVNAATGRVLPVAGRSRFMYELSRVSCEAWHRTRTNAAAGGRFVYPTGYLWAMRKDLLSAVEVENAAVNDDAVIGLELYKKGVRCSYCPAAEVWVQFPQNIRDFIKQKTRTRLGRRQYECYKEAFLGVEREWRRSILQLTSQRTMVYCFAHLLGDAYCRALACETLMCSRRNFHLWDAVTSTKVYGSGASSASCTTDSTPRSRQRTQLFEDLGF